MRSRTRGCDGYRNEMRAGVVRVAPGVGVVTSNGGTSGPAAAAPAGCLLRRARIPDQQGATLWRMTPSSAIVNENTPRQTVPQADIDPDR